MVKTVEEFLTLAKASDAVQSALLELESNDVIEMLAKHATVEQFIEMIQASLNIGYTLSEKIQIQETFIEKKVSADQYSLIFDANPTVILNLMQNPTLYTEINQKILVAEKLSIANLIRYSEHRFASREKQENTSEPCFSQSFKNVLCNLLTPEHFVQLVGLNLELAMELWTDSDYANKTTKTISVEAFLRASTQIPMIDSATLYDDTLNLISSMSSELANEVTIEKIKIKLFHNRLKHYRQTEDEFQRALITGHIALNNPNANSADTRNTLTKCVDKIIELVKQDFSLIQGYLAVKETLEIIVVNCSIEQFLRLVNALRLAPTLPLTLTPNIIAFVIKNKLSTTQFIQIMNDHLSTARGLASDPTFIKMIAKNISSDEFANIVSLDIVTACCLLSSSHLLSNIKNQYSFTHLFELAKNQFEKKHQPFLSPVLAETVANQFSYDQFMVLANHHLPSAFLLLSNSVLKEKFLKNISPDEFISIVAKCANTNNDPLKKSSIITLVDDIDPTLKKELEIDLVKEEIFHKKDLLQVDAKLAAILRAIAQIYILLKNPVACAPYLKFINDEVERYHQETNNKAFPAVSSSSYHFEGFTNNSHSDFTTLLPVPEDDYHRIEKLRSFPEFLMLFMQQYGFKENAYRWLGFIPGAIANSMLIEGQFVTEGLVTDAQLIHGKHSHMLQLAMIFCAIDDGKIDLSYKDHNSIHTLIFSEVLSLILHYKTPISTGILQQQHHSGWSLLFDTGYNIPVGFCSPGQLNSFLMQPEQNTLYPALSNYLIDSVCTRFIKMLKLFNYDKDTYIEKLKLKNNATFDNLTNETIAKIVPQDKIQSDATFSKYAIVAEKYHPNGNFSPRLFSKKITPALSTNHLNVDAQRSLKV